MFDASLVVCPDGWVYHGVNVPCFPSIPHHLWIHHPTGWEGRLPVWKVEKGDYSIAIINREELIGFSTVLP
jgi:hypothetical protein